MFKVVSKKFKSLDCHGPITCLISIFGCATYRIHVALNGAEQSLSELEEDMREAWYFDKDNVTEFEESEIHRENLQGIVIPGQPGGDQSASEKFPGSRD